jgi:peptide/nickel transport system substrate-binding protein
LASHEQGVTMTRNQDYWKNGRPYLDGIEFTIIRDVSTANLAFVVDKLDWVGMAIPLLKDVKGQAPEAICEVTPGSGSRNLIVNRDMPPFDNADMRRAMALSLDHKAFIDIISEGQGDIGGVMQPLPEGVWGMPPDVLNAPAAASTTRTSNFMRITPVVLHATTRHIAIRSSTRRSTGNRSNRRGEA